MLESQKINVKVSRSVLRKYNDAKYPRSREFVSNSIEILHDDLDWMRLILYGYHIIYDYEMNPGDSERSLYKRIK